MSILIFLIPITLGLALTGLVAFLWSIKNKQYDDLEGAANRILFDEDLEKKSSEKNRTSAKK
ncbi:MAG TPA: cbb3-type cytochrome oxidase assembly protein CcoS [Rickettsiales bacterium]|nr:cbb3-type cytochrome oxidase assembly protein CcoS [Rickettsiales bacterium]